MEEILYTNSSKVTKMLFDSLKKEVKYLYDKVLMGNVEFLVVVAPNATDGVDDPGNIYIDIDYHGEDFGEFTISYGFSHVHLSFGENLKEDINCCVNMVKQIVNHEIYAFYFVSSLNNKYLGFRHFDSDDEVYAYFVMYDLKEVYKIRHENTTSSVEELLKEADSIENKEVAQINYVLFAEKVVSKYLYIDRE